MYRKGKQSRRKFKVDWENTSLDCIQERNCKKNRGWQTRRELGESDRNVNVANAYRMADALIKADKNFDLLVLPRQSHTYDDTYKAYFQRRLRAYFARYLLNP